MTLLASRRRILGESTFLPANKIKPIVAGILSVALALQFSFGNELAECALYRA